MLCLLAAAGVAATISAASSAHRQYASLARQHNAVLERLEAAHLKLLELADVEFVRRHLREYSVGPYLLTASDRVAKDISSVMELLGCERDVAIKHILRGTVGPEHAGQQER